MAKVLINRGSVANDGTGDNLRAGANKVNLNFDEIYTAIGDGTTLSANIKVKDDSSTVATINAKGEVLGILGGTGLSSTVSGSDVTLAITGFGAGADVIPGKVEGTDFTDSLLIGHSTTGTLSGAERNTIIGIDAGNEITSGDNNLLIGFNSGTEVKAGGANVALGGYTLAALDNNHNNTAVGYISQKDATGAANTSLGYGSLEDVTGNYNIGIGYTSGGNITSGSGNVIIGGVTADSATGSRQLKIAGNDGSTTTTWITGDSAGKVTIPGDLDVQGSQTVIDSATIQITNSFTFEGATSDDKETVLTVIDPTADRTVSLPNATGTVVLKDTTDLLTNKSIDLATNTLTGTTANFNTALSDGSFATLAGTETLTNKTISGSTNSVTNLSAAALTSGTINLSSSGNKLRFNFAGTGALPNEATYEGMFAYDTTGNAPYVADAAGWTKIVTENMSVSALSDVNISGVADTNGLVWSSAQGRFNAAAIPTAGFSIAMAVAL